MIVLSYGYEKPQNTDTGDIVFPALERNWQRVNDHTHDGINSAPLSSTSQTIYDFFWTLAPIGGGVYRQLVTIPSPYDYDTADIWFRLSTGEFVYPSIERVSANSFYIYTNDPTLEYTAYYR